MEDVNDTADGTVCVEDIHHSHPLIRAEDWRSPLVARLLDDGDYRDGEQRLEVSYRDETGRESIASLRLTWSGIGVDYGKCLNTYQATVLTEFAALGVACILCDQKDLEITEVTRRGEKVDYWIGDREALLEVSGTKSGDLADLCDRKAADQLLQNPFRKDGFVCVARFSAPAARLWFYPVLPTRSGQ